MATDAKFNALVGLEFEDLHRWTSHIPDALELWGSSGEPLETGLSIATNSVSNTTKSTSFWEHLKRDKSSYHRFTDGSAYLYGNDKFWAREVQEGFNWGDIGDATIVDVSTEYRRNFHVGNLT
jgi:hypothetical protein